MFILRVLTFFVQKVSCHCSSSQNIQIELLHFVASWVWYPFNGMSLLYDVVNYASSSVLARLHHCHCLSIDPGFWAWILHQPLHSSCSEMCSNWMSHCCQFQHPVVKHWTGHTSSEKWSQPVCGHSIVYILCLLNRMKIFELTYGIA